MVHMSRFSRLFPVFALAAAAWFGLHACSSMQGKLAPELVSGEVISHQLSEVNAALPNTGWRLLNFFGPG